MIEDDQKLKENSRIGLMLNLKNVEKKKAEGFKELLG